MAEFKGIDVSHWQGTIDWEKVRASGVEFAIVKAGGSNSGAYTDSRWEENYKGAKATGIAVGAYYYAGEDCVTASAGKADAERFIGLLSGKRLDYPVYIDVEAQPVSARSGITDAVIAFCETMEKAGYFVGIYGSTISGFRNRMDDSRLTSYAHWVAQYADKCTYAGSYGVWQYSSSGSVDGISGRVDLDVSYIDYPTIIISGGFNGYGSASEGTENQDSVPSTAKTVTELAGEVIAGRWGNGAARKTALTEAGYDYAAVQAKVREILYGTSAEAAVYYVVQSGDTLYAIAKKYGTSIAAIQKLNPALIKNVSLIVTGWRIRVK